MRMLAVLLLLFSISLAQLKVVATYPWIGELVKEVGKDRVSLYVIAKGTEDPHFVVPKPSHIAKMRDADLLIVQGASLEVGFLPPLLQQSNNPKIQPGRQGYLELSQFVELIEKPVNISRAMGDVHPEGNPHYQLDPHNIPPLARAIVERLCQLDSPNCSYYRGNLEDFLKRWNARLTEWDREFAKLKGIKVIQYHKLYDYLLQRYRTVLVGTLEPLPGIPPTGKHIEGLISQAQGVKFILQDVYHEKRTAQFVAQRLNAKVVILPHDVGAVPEAKDLFSLFDEILRRLSQ
ncbi:zinc ABC transporter substrate-binding protein [Thermocrinis sp.]|jgi:zinc/manganese transport system substrate-binding protein|uniref:metal ABC transporter solute-binding protein, Zn/Mn family n=1 Tax=Thermocrinis sp. TaxID=2024383 RepID=UPI00261FC766|nr:zinc ABC transporter substrate-binding protein [Thermocrinis sp.]